jgi:uncharacterized C2H2 Zn-finger protein
MIQKVRLGEELLCPICGKLFKVTDNTKYIMNGEYTCSWKCFYNEARNRDETMRGKKKR